MATIPTKMLTGYHGDECRPMNLELKSVITAIRWAVGRQKTVSERQDCEAEGLRVTPQRALENLNNNRR